MAKPTKFTNRASGCFLVVFFSIFLSVGCFAIFAAKKAGSHKADIYIPIIVGAVFALVGAGGVFAGLRLLITGKSGSNRNKSALTGLPPVGIVKPSSNGTYELKSDSSHKSNFWGLLIFSLFWNGITWTILIAALRDMKGAVKIFPIVFLSIFVLIGLGMLCAAIYNLFGMILTGQTRILLSAPVLSPGQSASFSVNQSGSYAITSLQLELVCEESATFRQGTDTRTKTEIVETIPIAQLTSLQARNGQSVTQQTVKIPSDAMPSFEAPNNRIHWFIKVTMDIPGRPDVKQKFKLRVLSPQSIALEGVSRA